MRERFTLTTILTLAAAAMPGVALAQSADVTVVHGLNGNTIGRAAQLPVDIAVNGACTLTNFQFGDFVTDLALPPGTYDIEISLFNHAKPCTNATVIAAMAKLNGGEDVSIVAHVDTEGAPTASVFANMPGATHVRHTANAPTVDVRVRSGGSDLATLTLDPGAGSGPVALPKGGYQVAILAPGTSDVLFGNMLAKVRNNSTTEYYAVGDFAAGAFSILEISR